ncbi:MAG: glycerol kinase GlpK [Agarilytica sp.]
MSLSQLILAIDQGTTSSRAIVFDKDANVISVAQQEFTQHYPDNGWVEHDPEEIWSTTLAVSQQAVSDAEKQNGQVVAIGITNQRETTIVWDRDTGKPIYNAIVWQDRRTADVCQLLKDQNLESDTQARTGLLLDPYFSATKVAWILDNVDGARKKAEAGKLAFGTVDSFLLSRLTKGAVHATDATNASRTSLYNINTGDWDDALLKRFNVPKSVLPDVRDCAADFGSASADFFGKAIPIAGIAGDQQAAAIGQACFHEGETKSTYGTGCFAMMNIGKTPSISQHRLLTTVAYQLDGEASYALEGSIFMAGAAVQWLRDEMKLIQRAEETENIAASIDDTNGVYLVPAFTGLGAPYWEPSARGALVGLSRGAGRAEVVRATLESVCYQTHDLTAAMAADSKTPHRVRVDGGMVANHWVLQYLADILNVTIDKPKVIETTALGAAFLAGLHVGIYKSLEDIRSTWQLEEQFSPNMSDAVRTEKLEGWRSAVKQVLTS